MPQMTLLRLEPEDTLSFCKTASATSPNRLLKISNTTGEHVSFKVKTTAPKAYLVRPSAGVLTPHQVQEVTIILQPQSLESSGNTNQHRFLVQAAIASSAEPVTREQWATLPKESIQEHRLNVQLEEREPEAAPTKPHELKEPAGLRPSNATDAPSDLREKYDELVQYTLMLEKEKKKLETELANMSSSKSGSSEGYGNVHMLLVAILCFLIAYSVQRFS